MKYVLLVFLVFLLNSSSIAQKQKTETLEYLKKEMKEQGIPGLQIAVIKNDELILNESLGLANVEFSVPTKENTIFSINSIAKIFASTAIMQLVEEDKINLQRPISDYLDELPANWQKVTLIQLLSHTSGLPDIEDPNTGELVGGKGQDTAWVQVQKMPLQFDPGEDFSYNATNYLLIQRIIEKFGEMPFEKFIQKRQLDIAGMDRTVYGNSFDVIEDKSPTYCFYRFNKAIGDYVKGEKLVETYEDFPTIMRADAGIFSTANDISKWIIALQTGKLLKQRSNIQTMWKPVKLNNGKYGGFGGILNGYGLDWPVIIRPDQTAFRTEPKMAGI